MSTMRGGRIAGKGLEKPPSAPPRAAPYTARAPGKSRVSSRLTEEEVNGLMKLDDDFAKATQQVEELKQRVKDTKQSTRDDLDACKKEIRGGKRNAEALERVEEDTARRLEAVNVMMLGNIADDEHHWGEVRDNEDLKQKEGRLTQMLAEVQATEAEAEREFTAAREQRVAKEAEVDALKGRVRSLEVEEEEFCRNSLALEGVKARAEQGRSEAEQASETKKTVALDAIEKRNTADSEVASANQVRSRMQARVDKLSNTIKGLLYVPADVVVPTLVLKPGTPVTELTVGQSNMAFSLDKVLDDAASVQEVFQNAATSPHAKSLVVVTPAAISLLPTLVKESIAWAIAALPDAKVAAVEIHEERVRDLLVRDPAYHEKLIHGGEDKGYDLEGGFFKGLEAGDVSCVDVIDSSVAARVSGGSLSLRSGVTFAVQLRTAAKVLTVLCAPSLPQSKDDVLPHILHSLAKMSSDVKEGKGALRKTLAGKLALSAINDSAHTSTVSVASSQSTAQTVVDACRCLHRMMMVDLGVRPTA